MPSPRDGRNRRGSCPRRTCALRYPRSAGRNLHLRVVLKMCPLRERWSRLSNRALHHWRGRQVCRSRDGIRRHRSCVRRLWVLASKLCLLIGTCRRYGAPTYVYKERASRADHQWEDHRRRVLPMMDLRLRTGLPSRRSPSILTSLGSWAAPFRIRATTCAVRALR